ncbi:MAG: hypothetical protein N3E41_08720 [Thermofilaceae archaeon]|nr:hypothetical protein [Thermofilaceae archaeon]
MLSDTCVTVLGCTLTFLSILSQLLFRKEGNTRGLVQDRFQFSFNSFPVAVWKSVDVMGAARKYTFNSFPVAVKTSYRFDVSAGAMPFNSFPVAVAFAS